MDNYWYYQVWFHNIWERRVILWDTYDTRSKAEKEAMFMNQIENHDTPGGATITRFYFVRAIAKRDFVRPRAKVYKRLVEEGIEAYMKQYRGELLPYCNHIVRGMFDVVISHPITNLYLMEEEGGILSCEGEDYDGINSTKGFVTFYGNNIINFEVAFVHGAAYASRIVRIFLNVEHLMAWLSDVDTAAKESERKLMELVCDRYNGLLNLTDRYLKE